MMLWEMGKGFACDLLLFSFLLLSRSEFSPLLSVFPPANKLKKKINNYPLRLNGEGIAGPGHTELLRENQVNITSTYRLVTTNLPDLGLMAGMLGFLLLFHLIPP